VSAEEAHSLLAAAQRLLQRVFLLVGSLQSQPPRSLLLLGPGRGKGEGGALGGGAHLLGHQDLRLRVLHQGRRGGPHRQAEVPDGAAQPPQRHR